MKSLRATTMYNVLESPRIINDITEVGHYELVFHDIHDRRIAIVLLQKQNTGFIIHKVESTDPSCSVVQNRVIDSVKRRFLSIMLGIDFGKCYDNYAIMVNKDVIAKISVDELTHVIKIKASSHITCQTRKLPDTYVIEIDDAQCDILDSMGIDHDKQTLSDSGIHMVQKHSALDERSLSMSGYL
jgi:hypothetical protein